MTGEPQLCPRCGGRGDDPEPDTEATYEDVCCGQVLPTGECCAALYGGERMERVQTGEYPVQTPCRMCGGALVVPTDAG